MFVITRRHLTALVLLLVFLPSFAAAEISLAQRLSGKVLIQVQSKGEAWYVNPLNQRRYYLGRPQDASKVIGALALGVSNKDFDNWRGKAPARLAGRLLLKVQDLGQAYYVHPVDLQIHYLGTLDKAFDTLKNYGLGITDADLAKITPDFNYAKVETVPVALVSQSSTVQTANTKYEWNFKSRAYTIYLDLSANLYQSYTQSSKVYKYYGALPTDWREDYYQMFMTPKATDNTVKSLATQFRSLAQGNNLDDDAMVDLMLSFVQSIPYDNNKDLVNGKPNYPYETLFTKTGVCSDKTFLAVMILRELGYGAAVIDMPDVNHSAVGIQCSDGQGVNGTKYCYGETTNYFPIGAIPRSLGNAVATNVGTEAFKGQFANIFKTDQLGTIEIVQQTTGKIYQGIVKTKSKVESILQLESDLNLGVPELNALKDALNVKISELNQMKTEMDYYQTQVDITKYNTLVPLYNAKIIEYNQLYDEYKTKSDLYNIQVTQYNQMIKDFYPNN